jgi:hypothetical protein
MDLLLQKCEDDTRKLLGNGAANRLGNWRQHAEAKTELIGYIKKLLRGNHRANGFELDRKGGLSLERIVLDQCPEFFDSSDREEAKRTLDIS